jgi:HK97 gp10 family phage protein
MLSINFDKKSLNAFYKYLNDLESDVADFVRAEVEDSMLAIETEAASNVRVDTGALKQSIQSTPIKVTKDQVTGGVEVGAFYAPYIEFGTGGGVVVPTELKNFAMQFKGTTGRKRNFDADPFFYPAVFKQRKELPKRIEKTLATLLKKKQ